jgi:hypothetical protein
MSAEAGVAIREQQVGAAQWRGEERRRWARQTINRVVAVRGTAGTAERFQEMAVLINLGRGGALLAISRPLVHASRIALHPVNSNTPAADTRSWRMVRLRFREPLSDQQLQILSGVEDSQPAARGFRALLSHALAFIPRPA